MRAETEKEVNLPEIIPIDQLSAGRIWRVVVLMTPGQKLGLAGEFGHDLADSHKGELIFGCVIDREKTAEIDLARQTLVDAYTAAAADQFEVANLTLIQVDRSKVGKELQRITQRHGFDFVLTRADSFLAAGISRLPCDIGILRGDWEQLDRDPSENHISKILVPSAGGPNTTAAFDLLSPLCEQREITALYIAPTYLGNRERAHGYNVLRQLLQLTDVHRFVQRKVVSSPNAAVGIIDEAAGDYDLVILGANEDTLDRVLFGDIVGRVVRESKKPVLIMRRHRAIGSGFVASLDWRLRQLMPHLDREARHETYSRIRQNSRAEVSYYVLISLAAAIAGFGLLQNSPAVVIGAMLVAPLMSPIVGVGMSMVLGEVRFLRMAVQSVFQGVGLALLVGCLVGVFWIGQDILPSEVLARTAPNLLDLGIAIFSGFAAAYALCYSQAAGALPGVAIAAALVPPLATVGICLVTGNFDLALGALLLFGTNFISIVNASALVFFVLGFRPTSSEKAEQMLQLRTFRLALALFALNAVILGFATFNLFQDAAIDTAVEKAIEQSVAEMALTSVDIKIDEPPQVNPNADNRAILEIELTVRSPRRLLVTEANNLQDSIREKLALAEVPFEEVALDLTVIQVAELEPEEITEE